MSALENHVAYFDPDGNGEITWRKTFAGLRGLGLPAWLCVPLTVLINGALGYLTHGRPTSVVSVRDIHKGVHPYDTGAFDAAGEFDVAHFDALFDRTAGPARPASPRDAITRAELRQVIVARGNADHAGLAGVVARMFSAAEAKLLFCLAADSVKDVDGRAEPALTRRRLRRFYTGNLLPAIARRHRLAAYRRSTL